MPALPTPLDKIDVSNPALWPTEDYWPLFRRLRHEAPVHWCAESMFGPYWSITRFKDIMSVDSNHEIFSSEMSLGGIAIVDAGPTANEMFIAMDPPRHDEQRKVVSPIVAPDFLTKLAPLIRERAAKILDELPRGTPFDWVDLVSKELTSQMLATLFDFPFEQRRKLPYWSDVASAIPMPGGIIETEEERVEQMQECFSVFSELWNERVNAPPSFDLISMMAHAPATRNMSPREFMGNISLLIVGGNDTTRNSITGSLLALSQNPDQFARLRANPALVPSMVSEAIRWQTPVAHMRRTAKRDIEFGGQTIRKGDKVIMWYVSGNRDETEIENPDAFIIDRPRPRHHLSFGFGIHRCVGNRMAELQLTIMWEEILKRLPVIEVVGEPVRSPSCFIKGYESMQVRIPS